jgi:hypothetical protein
MNGANFDEHGLPLGPAREQLWDMLLRRIDKELETHGWNQPAHSYTLTLLGADEEAMSESSTLYHVIDQGPIGGDPARSIWGRTVSSKDSVFILSVEAWTKPDEGDKEQEARLTLLVTKLGDTAELRRIRNEDPVFYGHGEGLDVPIVKVLKRVIGLPVEDEGYRAKNLLASWVTQQATRTVETVMLPADPEEEDEGTNLMGNELQEVGAAAAVVTTYALAGRLIRDWAESTGRALPTFDEAQMTMLIEEPTLNSLKDETCEIIGRWARKLGEDLTFSKMIETPMVGLLPQELSEGQGMAWAGEELAGWWVFNQVTATPQVALDYLKVVCPRASEDLASILKSFQWLPLDAGKTP